MTWQHLTVSPDGTHHLVVGQPAYAERFREVLKFHAPGLAPVLGADGATHIHPDGRAAYSHRFLRTFGFYEGVAAVETADGWVHITPDGAPLYPQRHAWCGNFQQGRCPVRMQDGRYHHITTVGDAAYAQRWRYAGDFRDGVAVVQRDDGLHTHIDLDGRPLHDLWFDDLDVFHKRFARARDRAGWMHIDARGVPVCARRFAAVEPFYNGQARVETYDGGLEVIDEAGNTLVTLRSPRDSGFESLSADLVGHWRTDTIAGAVQLGVIEALPATTGALAERLALNAERLDALLRGLGDLRLVRLDRGVWSLTPRGTLLRHDHPLTLADAALEYAGPLRERWAALTAAMQPGGWRPDDVFDAVAADAGRVVAHHRMLRSYARHDYAFLPTALKLRGDETVLDAGGGQAVLAGLLLDAHPTLKVAVLDRTEVLAAVPARPRLHLLAADLLAPWPVTADAVLLARVLHDWPDDDAVRILSHARACLRPGGKLYIIEHLTTDDGAVGGLCDLHLLLVTGGRDRSPIAYRQLLKRAGMTLAELLSTSGLVSILVGVPA